MCILITLRQLVYNGNNIPGRLFHKIEDIGHDIEESCRRDRYQFKHQDKLISVLMSGKQKKKLF